MPRRAPPAPRPRERREVSSCVSSWVRQTWNSARAASRGGRDGGDAPEKWPAWPAEQGVAVGPVKLELQKDLARHLRGGHPWVYKRAIERPPAGLQSGAVVDVVAGGKFVARGYYDAD